MGMRGCPGQVRADRASLARQLLWLLSGVMVAGGAPLAAATDDQVELNFSAVQASPRGAYYELESTEHAFLALETGGLGIGTSALSGAILAVQTRPDAPVVSLLPGEGADVHLAVGTATPVSGARWQVQGMPNATSQALFLPGEGGQLRVGIGTPTPQALLDIHGADTSASTRSLAITNSENTATLSVLNNGTVGVGTLTPAARLEVTGLDELSTILAVTDQTGAPTLTVTDVGNVGIGVATGIDEASPVGERLATGNLNVNDVWLRSTGRWLSGSADKHLSFYNLEATQALTNVLAPTSLSISRDLQSHEYCGVMRYQAIGGVSSDRVHQSLTELRFRVDPRMTVQPPSWSAMSAVGVTSPTRATVTMKTPAALTFSVVCMDWNGQTPGNDYQLPTGIVVQANTTATQSQYEIAPNFDGTFPPPRYGKATCGDRLCSEQFSPGWKCVGVSYLTLKTLDATAPTNGCSVTFPLTGATYATCQLRASGEPIPSEPPGCDCPPPAAVWSSARSGIQWDPTTCQ